MDLKELMKSWAKDDYAEDIDLDFDEFKARLEANDIQVSEEEAEDLWEEYTDILVNEYNDYYDDYYSNWDEYSGDDDNDVDEDLDLDVVDEKLEEAFNDWTPKTIKACFTGFSDVIRDLKFSDSMAVVKVDFDAIDNYIFNSDLNPLEVASRRIRAYGFSCKYDEGSGDFLIWPHREFTALAMTKNGKINPVRIPANPLKDGWLKASDIDEEFDPKFSVDVVEEGLEDQDRYSALNSLGRRVKTDEEVLKMLSDNEALNFRNDIEEWCKLNNTTIDEILDKLEFDDESWLLSIRLKNADRKTAESLAEFFKEKELDYEYEIVGNKTPIIYAEFKPHFDGLESLEEGLEDFDDSINIINSYVDENGYEVNEDMWAEDIADDLCNKIFGCDLESAEPETSRACFSVALKLLSDAGIVEDDDDMKDELWKDNTVDGGMLDDDLGFVYPDKK